MHRHVRDLYKRFLIVGRDYPLGLAYVRGKAKAALRANAHLTTEDDIARAVYKGRWWVNELRGVIQLKKYRAMRARYGAAPGTVDDEVIAKVAQVEAAARQDAQPLR